MSAPASQHYRDAAVALSIFLGLMVLTAGCQKAPEPTVAAADWYQEQRTLYYGIPVQVNFQPANAELASSVWVYLENIDNVFNDYRPDSEVSRLNQDAGKSSVVSADMGEALNKALTLHRLSNGAFDITVGPLRRLWRNAEEQSQLPTAEAIAAAAAQCGSQHLSVSEGKLTRRQAGLQLDFGGLIKGIAVDRALSMLKNGGAAAAMVQIGGETASFGDSPRGKPHVIGIQHPRADYQAGLWCAMADQGGGMSLSTSGNYQNPIRIGETTYYHIFDPKSGQPVNTRVLSVSVYFPTTGKNWLADGLSTAGAIMGATAFLRIVAEQGGEALMLVEENGEIVAHTSPNWQAYTVGNAR